MSNKALVYTRKNGDRVLVFGGTIAGQLRFVPMKRTAIDGREWWCVYDNERGEWTNSTVLGCARWKMKIECARAIAEAIEKRGIPFEPYNNEESPFKSGKHKFVVDVHWDVARSYEVEAKSREEAQAIIQKRVDEGNVCVWTDNFEATDDVTVECHGEELKGEDGIQYSNFKEKVNGTMYNSQYWIEGRIVVNAYAKDIDELRTRLIDMVHDLDEKLTGNGVSGGVLVEKWREFSDQQDGDPIHGLVFDEKTDHGESGMNSMSMVVRHCDQNYEYN